MMLAPGSVRHENLKAPIWFSPVVQREPEIPGRPGRDALKKELLGMGALLKREPKNL
jgi:hypothetical protein